MNQKSQPFQPFIRWSYRGAHFNVTHNPLFKSNILFIHLCHWLRWKTRQARYTWLLIRGSNAPSRTHGSQFIPKGPVPHSKEHHCILWKRATNSHKDIQKRIPSHSLNVFSIFIPLLWLSLWTSCSQRFHHTLAPFLEHHRKRPIS